MKIPLFSLERFKKLIIEINKLNTNQWKLQRFPMILHSTQFDTIVSGWAEAGTDSSLELLSDMVMLTFFMCFSKFG